MRLASQAPVLVQLPDRQFGASAVLQSHLIPGHAGRYICRFPKRQRLCTEHLPCCSYHLKVAFA